jgi:hypothetical protein
MIQQSYEELNAEHAQKTAVPAYIAAYPPRQPLSRRALAWAEFSLDVVEHIESYTVPQYGDAGADIASEYTVAHCVEQMKKYIARAGRNSRGDKEAERDFLKIAHYAQMARDIYRQGVARHADGSEEVAPR